MSYAAAHPDCFRLLRLLADAEPRPAEHLARALECSPEQLLRRLRELEQLGLRWTGTDLLRLERPVDLIDKAALEALLAGLPWRFHVEILDQCDSTSTRLLERAREGAPHCTLIACEHQSAGRGRRGARWISMPGTGLAFSLLWRSSRASRELSGLSLAAGVAVARAAEALGAPRIGLKWPNDLLLGGDKLGGILVEMQDSRARSATGSALVIGVGLNVRIPEAMRRAIDVPVADLSCGGAVPSRTVLLAGLAQELASVLEQFDREGFGPLREEWLARHAMQDMPVALKSDDQRVAEGTAVGVGEDGALLLSVGGRLERYYAGELSLRLR